MTFSNRGRPRNNEPPKLPDGPASTRAASANSRAARLSGDIFEVSMTGDGRFSVSLEDIVFMGRVLSVLVIAALPRNDFLFSGFSVPKRGKAAAKNHCEVNVIGGFDDAFFEAHPSFVSH